MSDAAREIPRNLKIGSTLVFITGLFPTLTSLSFYICFWIGYLNPGDPWLSGQFPPGWPAPSRYTLNDIRHFDTVHKQYDVHQHKSFVATDFVLGQHIEFANILNTGVMVLVLTIFGLRRYQKWSWYVILGIFLWVGLNDGIAAIIAGNPPVPLIAEAIGIAGLLIARPAIFK